MTSRRLGGLIALVAASLLLFHGPMTVRAEGGAIVRVPGGTAVSLHPVADITGGGSKAGKEVAFGVDAPVVVDGVEVVRAGAPAIGTVIYAKGADVLHPEGALIVSVVAVEAADGSWISLRAQLQPRGSADGLLSASLYQARRSGLRGRHEDVLLPSGRSFQAFVDRDRVFERVAGGSSPVRALPPPAPPVPAGAKALLVPEGSVVSVSPAGPITSAAMQAGDRAEFRTTLPVTVDGRVVVASGARAVGTVIVSRGAARMGRAGELVVLVDAVQAVDGSWIPVGAAGERTKGKKHTGARAALSHFVPVVALLTKGQEAVVPPTAVFALEVRDDAFVVMPPAR